MGRAEIDMGNLNAPVPHPPHEKVEKLQNRSSYDHQT